MINEYKIRSKKTYLAFACVFLLISILAFSCQRKEPIEYLELKHSWPTYRYDSERTACVVDEPKLPLEQKWKIEYDLSDDLTAPVISGRKIIITAPGKITCFDRSNGSKIWSHSVANGFISQPSVYKDMVIFLGASKSYKSTSRFEWMRKTAVYALNIDNGKLLFCCSLPRMTDPSVSGYCIMKDRLVMVDNNAYVTIIKLSTGKIERTFKPSSSSCSIWIPFAQDEKLFIATGNEKDSMVTRTICCIDINNYSVLWTREYEYGVLPACAYDGSLVVLPSFASGQIQSDVIDCLDVNSGERKWGYSSVGVIRGDVDQENAQNSMTDEKIKPPEEGPFEIDKMPKIPKPRVVGPPFRIFIRNVAYSMNHNSLFFGNSGKKAIEVHCLDGQSGQLKWKRTLDSKHGLLWEPIITGRFAWIVSTRGPLFCFDIESGRIVESLSPKDSYFFLNVISADGYLYTLTTEGQKGVILTCYQ
ncbi:MAG: PQQ-binding-like beta-propeller repeat protein [Actinomycetota bacterium]|nr:PQQ-binding-like beta-propeller repeat protein [Actinomycetota bacterium]